MEIPQSKEPGVPRGLLCSFLIATLNATLYLKELYPRLLRRKLEMSPLKRELGHCLTSGCSHVYLLLASSTLKSTSLSFVTRLTL